MIPESFIQEILSRVDIVDLVDGHVPLKKAGANYAACCPFHSEKTPSFTVSPSKQFYHCFGCGAHGTAIGFLMEYSGLSFLEAVRDLAHRCGLQVPEVRGTPMPQYQHSAPLLEVMRHAAAFYRDRLKQSPSAVDYLKKRGLSGEIARDFGLGYAPDAWQGLEEVFPNYSAAELQEAGLVIKNDEGRLYDRFRDRIMFPIANQKGEIIAFGGRVIGAGEPKYLNSPETPLFEKGRELFGLPQAREGIRAANEVVVVEGYMDVVALHQHGVRRAVATLGTATTPMHAQKLLRLADRVVFCFDGDNAGRKAAWRALESCLESLADDKAAAFVFLPEGEDPDTWVRQNGNGAFDTLCRQAMPLSDFLLRELSSHADTQTAEGRARLVHEAKPLLARLRAPMVRLQLVKRLAETTGFSQTEVERLCELAPVAKAQPARAPRRPPSLLRALIRLILQHPDLVHKLPEDFHVEEKGEEEIALATLVAAARRQCGASYASLRESLRGQPGEALLAEIAAGLLDQPLEEEEIDNEFSGILSRLRETSIERAFDALSRKAEAGGLAALSPHDKAEYLRLLQEKEALKRARKMA